MQPSWKISDPVVTMSQRHIPILMYHQTAPTPPKGAPLRGLVVSPQTFSRQMAALAALGFRGLSMTGLQPYLSGEKQGRVVGITFDDGYENTLRNALPVLQRHGFSSTCYVVSGMVGQRNAWDAHHGIAQVPLMTREQLQLWIDGGQEVGSHSVTHADLGQLAQPEQLREVLDSKSQLENMVNQPQGVQHFCYPYGHLNDSAVECVRHAGYLTATTTARGRVAVTSAMDKLLLPRVLVSRTTSWPQLLLKCLTHYEEGR